MHLADYFTRVGQQRALAAYSTFAQGSAWSVPMKMELYAASAIAFEPTTPETEAVASFKKIYSNLVSYWQVFRPHKPTSCWPASTIFETIRELGAFARGSGMNLANFSDDKQAQALMLSLMSFENMKPNRTYPVMAVSKFLHFFNPALFPIYDTEVIWIRVFGHFMTEYKSFCALANLDPKADGAPFLRNYVRWAHSLLAPNAEENMNIFVQWLESELPPRNAKAFDRTSLLKLYATAFEFTAIGATVAEGA